MTTARLTAAALVLLTALTLAACGGTESIETTVVRIEEEDIKRPVRSAACPPDAEEGPAGSKFRCTVTPEQGAPYEVELTKNEDDSFTSETLGEGAGAAGGGGAASSDEEEISAVIEAVGQDSRALCGVATDAFVTENFGSVEECLAAAEGQPATPLEVEDITIEGETATVTGTDSDGGPVTLGFERVEDGSWEIASQE